MVINLILDMVFIPINILIMLLPKSIVQDVSTIQIPQIVRWGACFFPLDVMTLVVTMFISWYVIFMTWAIIEWVYKKIPGVS